MAGWYISSNFTPFESGMGGLLIGISSTLYLLFSGRITGMSGFLGGVLLVEKDSFYWKALYVATMVAMGALAHHVAPQHIVQMETPLALSWSGYIAGGFLVGLGTRLGNGCTSGHGVCGIPRLSLRSVTAVILFMTSGICMGTIIHANTFLLAPRTEVDSDSSVLRLATTALGVALFSLGLFSEGQASKSLRLKEVALTATCAALFAAGLVLSGMVQQSKVWGFLSVLPGWDPSLMFVMGGAVCLNLVTFQTMLHKLPGPIICLTGDSCPRFKVPANNRKINWELIYGALIFGFGWGLSGICPGPMMVLVGAGYPKVTFGYLPALAIGMYAAGELRKSLDPEKPDANPRPHEGSPLAQKQ